jgi:hypothetical protein
MRQIIVLIVIIISRNRCALLSLHFTSLHLTSLSPHLILSPSPPPPPQGVCTSGLVVVHTLHRRLFLLLATSLFTQHSLLLHGWMECLAVSSGNTKFLHFSNVASTLPANEQRPACHGISQRLLGRAEQSKAKQSKHADKKRHKVKCGVLVASSSLYFTSLHSALLEGMGATSARVVKDERTLGTIAEVKALLVNTTSRDASSLPRELVHVVPEDFSQPASRDSTHTYS